jgi:hypothetical protein
MGEEGASGGFDQLARGRAREPALAGPDPPADSLLPRITPASRTKYVKITEQMS